MIVRRIATWSVVLAVFLAGVPLVRAQTESDGQFCVRAFEDRNGNQQLDGGEPFMTRGVAAQLLDAGGVVVATAMIDDSPTAAQGVICFAGLAYGQYTILLTSPDYARTTSDSMTASINPGDLPTVFVYGAQHVAAPAPDSAASQPILTPGEQTALLERVILAAGAALIVLVIMLALGVVIYFVAFRSRLQHAVPDVYMSPRVTTGSHPAVRASDSGEHPKMGG